MNGKWSMTRRQAGLAAVVVVLLAGAAFVLWRFGPRESTPEQTPATVESPVVPQTALETLPVKLYFPGGDGRLYSELWEAPADGEIAERMAAVLNQLLAGPQSGNLRPPLADGIQVGQVYLVDGQAIVDLILPEGEAPPVFGSRREILTVYSLVNSLLFNFSEAEQVVLLWNGRQRETFAGHIDTTHPLHARSDLVAP